MTGNGNPLQVLLIRFLNVMNLDLIRRFTEYQEDYMRGCVLVLEETIKKSVGRLIDQHNESVSDLSPRMAWITSKLYSSQIGEEMYGDGLFTENLGRVDFADIQLLLNGRRDFVNLFGEGFTVFIERQILPLLCDALLNNVLSDADCTEEKFDEVVNVLSTRLIENLVDFCRRH
jgi:hypothetical protein